MTEEKKHNGVMDAILAAGTQEKMAAQLGVSQQVISKWLKYGWVPIRRAQEIETLYGVPRRSIIHPRLVDLMDVAAD